jgi:hypothetical protein
MTALCIGLALVWLIVTLRGSKTYSVEGVPAILFVLGVAYGLGTIVLMVLKR